jgi:ammonia channel protein AmtB
MEVIDGLTAILVAPLWPGAIWGIVEILSEIVKARLGSRFLPILPLAIGAASGPTMVAVLVALTPQVESFPIAHSIVIGIGAGAFATSIHETKKARNVK